MSRLGTEYAFEVLVRARALEARGKDVVHLELGEPDFATPAHVVEAGVEALRGGHTHYGPAAGLPELRDAIARRVSATRGVEVRPEEVVVLPGAKPVLFLAALALLEEGDEALVPDPGFPIYDSAARFAGATVVPYPLDPARGLSPDPAAVASRLSPRTKLVFLNSPGNPAGGVSSPEDLGILAEALRGRDCWVLSDEIYSEVLYGGRHASVLPLPGMRERTILLDGFSKTWAMTGWRVGYGVMPEPLAREMARMQVNSTSCTAAFTQRAALAALEGPAAPARAMVEELHRRRDAAVEGLNGVRGFRCHLPRGAFYAFPDVRGTGVASKALADRLLEEAGVASVAGTAFGALGEGYLRFNFGAPLQRILEGVRRIRGLLGAA